MVAGVTTITPANSVRYYPASLILANPPDASFRLYFLGFMEVGNLVEPDVGHHDGT
jgi:hypothetical protein